MHEQWGTRIGFILATIGGAVGLGNLWRFAYVAGENGGGAFLLVYLVCILLIALPLVVAELFLGRSGQGDAIQAFAAAAPGSRWRLVGWLGVAAAFVILSYYAVIAGWALSYLAGALGGELWRATESGFGLYFERIIAHPLASLFWMGTMLAGATVIVAGGVRRGIERANLWLMPMLALLILAMAGVALSLPGGMAGVDFLLRPDWSALAHPAVYLNALGQAFFSIGIGMAFFVTYGSYLQPATRIPGAAATVVIGDTLFALVAGLAIFPTVFAFGADPAAGPRLAFVTLPQIFVAMPGGWLFGTLFFFLLSAAALTSLVALLEVPVASLVHRTAIGRKHAAPLIGGLAFLIGIPSALSYGTLAHLHPFGMPLLDFIDHGVSNFALPASGLLLALFVGWRVDAAILAANADLAGSRLATVWRALLRYVVPVAILVILLRSTGLL
ncbi:MAG: sodium-dependent transporter [Rhodospirillaceae bacterium]|nr:sodium-dependent transporter [Rhodospirillaceae bacterium]